MFAQIRSGIIFVTMSTCTVVVNSQLLAEETSPTHFSFTKHGTLISRPPEMRKPGPFWPSIVKMNNVESFPFDYALYYSTDHGKKGGIWLSVCSGDLTKPDNWKTYDQALVDGDFDYLEQKPKSNPIFIDTTQGRQTETPHANVIDGTVYMTYHNCGAGHRQSTLLSISKDGVNLRRINGRKDSVILDYNPRKESGNGHTGYFRWGPNRFSGLNWKYVGYSLHGGGAKPHYAMWGSNDIIHWKKLEILDASAGNCSIKGHRLSWPHIDPNSITPLGNGEYVAISAIREPSHGGSGSRSDIYEIVLSSKGNRLTRVPRKVLPDGLPGTDDERMPSSIVVDDTWYMVYLAKKGRGKSGPNELHMASGKLDIKAPKSPKRESID